jgi:hypothetical protein
MRLIFLLLAGASLCAQTTAITGPLTDSSGSPASCSLSIRPVAVAGASVTVIAYQLIGGDLSGVTGGYGSPRSALRRAGLTLLPGTYTVLQSCAGQYGSRTYTWMVPPGGSFDINLLNSRGTYGRTIGELIGTTGSLTGTIGQQ